MNSEIIEDNRPLLGLLFSVIFTFCLVFCVRSNHGSYSTLSDNISRASHSNLSSQKYSDLNQLFTNTFFPFFKRTIEFTGEIFSCPVNCSKHHYLNFEHIFTQKIFNNQKMFFDLRKILLVVLLI